MGVLRGRLMGVGVDFEVLVLWPGAVGVGQVGDFDELVGEDAVAAPGSGAVDAVQAVRLHAWWCLRWLIRPSQPVRHLISLRKPGRCSAARRSGWVCFCGQ
jgi:hypothetical protein